MLKFRGPSRHRGLKGVLLVGIEDSCYCMPAVGWDVDLEPTSLLAPILFNFRSPELSIIWMCRIIGIFPSPTLYWTEGEAWNFFGLNNLFIYFVASVVFIYVFYILI